MPFGFEASPVGYGSSLVIEELGPAGPDFRPRKVTLVGPSLPFMGAEWAVANNLVTTWYPGNSAEATQQVLGPRELPSTWEGEWNRTRMGRRPAIYSDESGVERRIVSPHLLREAVEAIVRAGVRLRVTWAVSGQEAVGSTVGGSFPRRNPDGTVVAERSVALDTRPIDVQIVREGRVATFRTPIDRHSDIRWSLEFHWYGRGGKQDKTASVREDEKADQAAAALEATVNATVAATLTAIVNSTPDVRKSATRFTLGHLENLASTPTRLVTQLTRQLQQNVSNFRRVGEIGKRVAAQPLAVQQAIIDFARNTKTAANDYQDLLGRRPAELNTNKLRVAAMLRAQNTFARISQTAARNARQAYELEVAQRDAVVSGGNRGALTVRESSTTRAGQLIAIHVTKERETPQTVSVRYYGNPDQGVAILRANRLPYHQPSFRPGTILVIPAVTNVAAQAGA